MTFKVPAKIGDKSKALSLIFAIVVVVFTVCVDSVQSASGISLHSSTTVMDSARYYPRRDQYQFSEKRLAVFRSWIDAAIKTSKDRGGYVIVIDKFGYELSLYKSGRLVGNFPIELGKNPIDDKFIEGDRCTPEGNYTITQKLGIGKTQFYKAFVISYPNAQDRKEYDSLSRNNLIGKKTGIGSAIEIHGQGSRSSFTDTPRNWTWGCISLKNTFMDALFEQVPVGTKVVIVKYTFIPKLPG